VRFCVRTATFTVDRVLRLFDTSVTPMKYAQFDYFPAECAHQEPSAIDYWSQHWKVHDSWRRDLRAEPIWMTIEDVIGQKMGSVLEAGCGTAQWVAFFDCFGHAAVGVDFSVLSLIQARKRNSTAKLLASDLRKLPFINESFDYIYCNGAVEHDPAGPEAALREFYRVLKPSGRLMCSVPCLNLERLLMLFWIAVRDWLKKRALLRRIAGKTDPFRFYQYLFSPEEYRERLESCGFSVLALRPYGFRKDGRLQRALGLFAGRYSQFYNPHMMMAICRKLMATPQS
jgi:SAM-dependent methyltransferase